MTLAPGTGSAVAFALGELARYAYQRLGMPAGTSVSGLESDGGDRFFGGGETSATVRAIRRPNGSKAAS